MKTCRHKWKHVECDWPGIEGMMIFRCTKCNAVKFNKMAELLLKYGGHTNECTRPLRPDCSCGWSALRGVLQTRMV